MSETPAASSQPFWSRRISLKKVILFTATSFIWMFILGSIYSVVSSGVEEARKNDALQKTRAIGLALFQYAQSHGGNYPEGKNSTEIFQQLLDQKYASDPNFFYFPMRGKSKADGMKLKPENVCWDVTNGVRPDDSDILPLVFLTGFKIHYIHNGEAIQLTHGKKQFLPTFMKNNATWIPTTGEDGIVHIFMSPEFDPKGRTYQQLTPDGPLP